MIPEHAPKEIVTFCEERGIEHIHIDTVTCIFKNNYPTIWLTYFPLFYCL